HLGVGEGLVDAVLGLLLALEVVGLAGDVGVPPGLVRADFERPQLPLVGGHELAGALGRLRAGEDRGAGHAKNEQPEDERQSQAQAEHGRLLDGRWVRACEYSRNSPAVLQPGPGAITSSARVARAGWRAGGC